MLFRSYEIITQKQASSIVLTLQGSASAPQNEEYNKKLSSRRIDSVTQFLKTYSFDGKNSLGDLVGTKIILNQNALGENVASIAPKTSLANATYSGKTWGSTDCHKDLSGADKIYSTDAMSCRAVILTNVQVIPVVNDPQPSNAGQQVVTAENGKPQQPKKPLQNANAVGDPVKALYKGASKKLLRYLLNECDYFQVMKAENPFI